MVDLNGMQLRGVSIGGFASCVDVPELKVAFDVGRLIDTTIPWKTILVTHTHADHVGALAQHVAQRGMRGLEPATYIVPPGMEGDLEELLGVWRRMDRGALRATIRPLEPGDEFALRRDLVVRPFETIHRVRSQGYLVSRVRDKLLPEFEGQDGAVIARAKQAGAAVTGRTLDPLLAVTGDTTIEGVLQHDDVLRAPRLVMESTFFPGKISVDEARKRGHVHVQQIADEAQKFECGALLLNHLSPRHTTAEAETAASELLPPELALRTQVWGPVTAT